MPHKSAAQGPGQFGTHHIELRGVPIELGVRTYAIWMAQRPMDFCAALDVADRQRGDPMFDTTGLRPLFNLSLSLRLERRSTRNSGSVTRARGLHHESERSRVNRTYKRGFGVTPESGGYDKSPKVPDGGLAIRMATARC